MVLHDFSSVSTELNTILNCVNGCEYSDIDDGRIAIEHLATPGDKILNVLHLNIRSLQKNIDNLLMLLSDLRDKGVVMHVIGLCEIFLTDMSLALVDIDNYVGYHRVRDGVGGVSVYVHNSVHFVKKINSPFTDCFESILLELSYQGNKIIFAEFYRIPNTNVKDFLYSFSQLITQLENEKFCILCADHNLDFLKFQQHRPTQDFLDLLNNELFVPCIQKPTRITHATSTLIDNIFLKVSKLGVHNSFVIIDHMSDHYPCLLSYKVKAAKEAEDVFIEKRKINDETMQKICESLLFQNWAPIYDCSVDQSYDFLLDVITKLLDKFAPKKIIQIKACDKFREPWLTVRLRKYNVKSQKLCNKARVPGKLKMKTDINCTEIP